MKSTKNVTVEVMNETTQKFFKILKGANVDTSAHSIFSPSASDRWMTCGASLIPNLVLKDSGNQSSAEGSVAHALAEKWLTTGESPHELIGTVVEFGDFKIEVNLEMVNHITDYVQFCKNQPGHHFVEKRVDFSMLTPITNQTGTCDFGAIDDMVLRITDLKYGKGVRVSVFENTQMLIYAIGMYYEYCDIFDIKRVSMTIFQPRMDNVCNWEISVDELLEWAEKIKARAHAAWCTDAEMKPEPDGACTFCKNKPTCPGLHQYFYDLTIGAFDNLDNTEPVTSDEVEPTMRLTSKSNFEYPTPEFDVAKLSLAQMVKIFRVKCMVEGFLNSVEDHLYCLAMAGETIPDYKLVEGQTRRTYDGSHELITAKLVKLGCDQSDLMKTELISLTNLKPVLKSIGMSAKEVENVIDGITVGKQTAPKLVPKSAKGKEFVVNSGFDDLENN